MFNIKKFRLLAILGLTVSVAAHGVTNAKKTGSDFGAGVGATLATIILSKIGYWWATSPKSVKNFSDLVANAKIAVKKAMTTAKQLESDGGFQLSDDQIAALENGVVVKFVFSNSGNLGVAPKQLLDYIKTCGSSGDSLLAKMTTTDGIVKALVSDDKVTGLQQGADPDMVTQRALKFAVEKGITSTEGAGRFVDTWRAQISSQPTAAAEGGFSTGTGRSASSAVSSAPDDFAQIRSGLAQAGRAGGRMVSNAAQAGVKQVQQGINDLMVQVERATRVGGAGSDFEPVKPTAPVDDFEPVEVA